MNAKSIRAAIDTLAKASYRRSVPMAEWARLPRHYFVTVAPANPLPFDEGMSLKVLLPARDRQHAMRRARRYVPGIITSVQLVKWTSEAPR